MRGVPTLIQSADQSLQSELIQLFGIAGFYAKIAGEKVACLM